MKNNPYIVLVRERPQPVSPAGEVGCGQKCAVGAL